MNPRPVILLLDVLIAAASQGQIVDTTVVEQAADSLPEALLETRTSATEEDLKEPFFSIPTYRISIGASFDFLEKFKASNIYGDLIIDLPAVLRTKKTTCGFLGGLYQLRSVTIDSFIPEQKYLISTTPLPSFDGESAGDTSIARISAAEGVKRIVSDNQCFFATLYRPWYLAADVPGSSGLYHLFYFGVLNRRDRISESYASVSDQEVVIGAEPDLPPLPANRQYTQNRTDMVFGFGQMLRHEFDDLALQFYGVATGMPAPFRYGYLMTFNAVGVRSGLIVGAEVRFDPTVGPEQYNVFLAKTFKVAEMAKLITSY